MAHVFISYSSTHRDEARRIADLLAAQSLVGPDGTTEPITVWWDKSLLSGDVFHREITQEIDEARVVVVIWSEGAVASDWVYAEAQRGAAGRKLVPLRDPALPHSRIPLPFAAFHIDDATNDAAVIASVMKRLGGTPSEDVGGLPGDQRWLLDPKAEQPRDRTVRNSPAGLLQAKFRIVPFIDFGDRREKLLAWARACDPAGRPITTAGKVIHGPGGLGKTRLMIEVARALADEGWLAGFVNRDTLGHVTRGPQLENLIRGREARGLLLVVDYAEGRTDDVKTLARLMLERERAGGAPARLVLLARAAGDWWSELARGSTDIADVFGAGEETTDELRLGDIAEGEGRVALWKQSVTALKPHLDAAGFREVCTLDPEAPPPDQRARLDRLRTDPDYARPLAIQMEALLWLRGAAPGAHEHGIPTMLDRIVGLEREHWKKVTAGVGMDALDRGVAQVTMVQGVDTRAQAIELLKADSVHFGIRTKHEATKIAGELAKLYGADAAGDSDERATGGPSDGLAPLEPDLIGEHLVAEKADPELTDACLRWIDSERAEAIAKRYHLLTVLLRATDGDHGDLARRAAVLLDHLARQLINILPKLPDEALAAIDAALPLQSLALMELAQQVAERRVDLAKSLCGTAGIHPTTSRWQRLKTYMARKLRAAAGAAANRAAPEAQEAILDHLAARVGTLGNRLSDLGRREDALAANQEAVTIYRRLAQTRPDAFLPNFAMSLGALAVALTVAERYADAAAATREGLTVLAPFAERYPQAFGRLQQALTDDYLAACAASGTDPDRAVLAWGLANRPPP